nr:hypothetical protein [Sphingorhabdus sp.]
PVPSLEILAYFAAIVLGGRFVVAKAWYAARNLRPDMNLLMTVAVLGGKPLCVTELKPKSGFYDFDAKYTDGLTEHVCPAEIPKDIEDYMMELAQRAHELLGCKGASRTDFRWDDELGREGVFVLETNTQPGMTPLSLVPEQAKQMGISYEQLVDILVKEALA